MTKLEEKDADGRRELAEVKPSPEEIIASMGLHVMSPEEEAEQERKERQAEEDARKSQRLSWYRSASSGVPERYWLEGLDTFNATDEETGHALKKARDFAGSAGCRVLILCGKPGTGKTHLGCGIVRERGGIYTPMLRLVYEADSTMSYKARETKIQLLDRLCSTPMLVLDELGRAKVREDYQKELASYIIGERYANRKPTVLISNLPKGELLAWLGEAVIDRLRECAEETVEMTGATYRMMKRTEVFGNEA